MIAKGNKHDVSMLVAGVMPIHRHMLLHCLVFVRMGLEVRRLAVEQKAAKVQ